MVTDAHAHILFPETAGACGASGPEFSEAGGSVTLRAGRYEIALGGGYSGALTSIEARLALMDTMGIDRQVVSPLPMMHFHDAPAADAIAFCRAHNDATAQLVRDDPRRFLGLAAIPMQKPEEAAAELDRAVRTLGLSGAQIGSHVAGLPLSHPSLGPVWDLAAEVGATIVVHPGPSVTSDIDTRDPTMVRNWDIDLLVGMPTQETLALVHLLFGGVLDARAELRVVIPHGGGFAPFIHGRLAFALKRRLTGTVSLKRGLEASWRQVHFDCLVHDPLALEFLLRAEGAERVLFGTNFAAWDQDDGLLGAVRGLALDQADEAAVLEGNAARLFAGAGGLA